MTLLGKSSFWKISFNPTMGSTGAISNCSHGLVERFLDGAYIQGFVAEPSAERLLPKNFVGERSSDPLVRFRISMLRENQNECMMR
mmetsp:Transcript_103/g.189  ORF Transcript_103/g.189 Transcript_103/m.189 type:complete len:86 (-) Transcript_103:80-337(-)